MSTKDSFDFGHDTDAAKAIRLMSETPMSMATIKSKGGLGGTVYVVLNALIKRGYVKRDGPRGKYVYSLTPSGIRKKMQS